MGIFVFGLAGLLQCYSEFRDLFSGVMVICEMRKFERVFCETTCETLCDWSIRRRVFRRLPVAVVVAATGAEGSAPHDCSYSFITRRTQHRTTKKDNNRTVYVQGSETVCVNMLSVVMLFVDSL